MRGMSASKESVAAGSALWLKLVKTIAASKRLFLRRRTMVSRESGFLSYLFHGGLQIRASSIDVISGTTGAPMCEVTNVIVARGKVFFTARIAGSVINTSPRLSRRTQAMERNSLQEEEAIV